MDIEKLIERLIAYAEKCDRLENGMGDEIMAAVTALSKLQAENEKLRAELEQADKSGKTKAYILDGFYCVICHKWHRRVKEIEVYLTRDEAEAALRREQDNG